MRRLKPYNPELSNQPQLYEEISINGYSNFNQVIVHNYTVKNLVSSKYSQKSLNFTSQNNSVVGERFGTPQLAPMKFENFRGQIPDGGRLKTRNQKFNTQQQIRPRQLPRMSQISNDMTSEIGKFSVNSEFNNSNQMAFFNKRAYKQKKGRILGKKASRNEEPSVKSFARGYMFNENKTPSKRRTTSNNFFTKKEKIQADATSAIRRKQPSRDGASSHLRRPPSGSKMRTPRHPRTNTDIEKIGKEVDVGSKRSSQKSKKLNKQNTLPLAIRKNSAEKIEDSLDNMINHFKSDKTIKLSYNVRPSKRKDSQSDESSQSRESDLKENVPEPETIQIEMVGSQVQNPSAENYFQDILSPDLNSDRLNQQGPPLKEKEEKYSPLSLTKSFAQSNQSFSNAEFTVDPSDDFDDRNFSYEGTSQIEDSASRNSFGDNDENYVHFSDLDESIEQDGSNDENVKPISKKLPILNFGDIINKT